MVTSKTDQHPWMLEDISLRALTASQRYSCAVKTLEKANEKVADADIQAQIRDLIKLRDASEAFGASIRKGIQV